MARNSTLSRNAETRELNTREQDMEYREPNMLDIPDTILERLVIKALHFVG